MSEEIIRVKVLREGKYRTTVSFDKLLVEFAVDAINGDLASFGKWLQERLEALEHEWANKAQESAVGEKVHADAGLSRLLQREVLKMIVEKARCQVEPVSG